MNAAGLVEGRAYICRSCLDTKTETTVQSNASQRKRRASDGMYITFMKIVKGNYGLLHVWFYLNNSDHQIYLWQVQPGNMCSQTIIQLEISSWFCKIR